MYFLSKNKRCEDNKLRLIHPFNSVVHVLMFEILTTSISRAVVVVFAQIK